MYYFISIVSDKQVSISDAAGLGKSAMLGHESLHTITAISSFEPITWLLARNVTDLKKISFVKGDQVRLSISSEENYDLGHLNFNNIEGTKSIIDYIRSLKDVNVSSQIVYV